MHMSLGNRLTWFLLLGVLVVTGLDLYWSITRTRATLSTSISITVGACLLADCHKRCADCGSSSRSCGNMA